MPEALEPQICKFTNFQFNSFVAQGHLMGLSHVHVKPALNSFTITDALEPPEHPLDFGVIFKIQAPTLLIYKLST